MIAFPFKRIFGLVGAMRVGKDSVANFLTETRGFQQIAFADQIKEEFGISAADFEAAKIAGNIEELREKLWKFSAQKKKEDPEYFIKKVIEKSLNSEGSVVITDIRTPEEMSAFLNIKSNNVNRIYWVRGSFEHEFDKNGCLAGSKLPEKMFANYMGPTSEYDLRCILNKKEGLYGFYRQLDHFFFMEDMRDIWEVECLNKEHIALYADQFEVRQKGSTK